MTFRQVLNPEQELAYAKEQVKRSCNAAIQRSKSSNVEIIALIVVAELIDTYDLVEYK
jgi:hypothetical protein